VVASVADLRVYFETKQGLLHAVDGVSFDIGEGETLGLVGETGCGKSVTARSFLRLVPTPPGRYAGGRILFRPHRPCERCEAAGCIDCGGRGRVPIECTRCGGSGCAECAGSGVETVDLLAVGEHKLRDIRGNRIAMIFQDPSKALNPALTVRQQLAEVYLQHRTDEILELAGVDGRMARRYASDRTGSVERLLLRLPPWSRTRRRIDRVIDDLVARALAETQIPNPLKVMQRYPHELSGGMRQRVMIAQALACDPDLLIADEPTTALDVTVQARILDLIERLQARHKSAVLYISHDLSLVRRICDRVAVMYAGRIVELGPTDRIFREPAHPYTRGLLGAIPSRLHPRGRLQAIEGTVPELIDPLPGCRFAGRCKHVMPACVEGDPPVVEVAPGHTASCLLHVGDHGRTR
jgi:oligopeptide/dipeptide ABC transporter ATP-binding protein